MYYSISHSLLSIKFLLVTIVFFIAILHKAVGATMYDVGLKRGTLIATGTWNSYEGECQYADGFLVAIDNETSIVAEKIILGEYGADPDGYGAGFLAGLQTTLKDVASKCSAKCGDVGKVSGKISAKMYCAVSIAVGRPASFAGMLNERHNLICGESYIRSCESAFFAATIKSQQACLKFANVPEMRRYYRAGLEQIGGACTYKTLR